MSSQLTKHFLLSTILISSSLAFADSVTIPIYRVAPQGQGEYLGTIKAEDSTCGVLLTPNLHGLQPGNHGFHVHVKPDCSDNGNAAGPHLDPDDTKSHLGPYAHGHLGDLPVLIVDAKGNATLPTLAPKFDLKTLHGHTLMIHIGADNYSDTPDPLGGGGARIACGVIK